MTPPVCTQGVDPWLGHFVEVCLAVIAAAGTSLTVFLIGLHMWALWRRRHRIFG
jgi:hypothetical protein